MCYYNNMKTDSIIFKTKKDFLKIYKFKTKKEFNTTTYLVDDKDPFKIIGYRNPIYKLKE